MRSPVMRRDSEKFANWTRHVLRGSQRFFCAGPCWLGGPADELVVQPKSDQVRDGVSRLLESFLLGLLKESWGLRTRPQTTVAQIPPTSDLVLRVRCEAYSTAITQGG
jgi:hypothetical protein